MAARTVIVTGAFGVLGSTVADVFARAGDRVARVDYAPPPPHGAPENGIDIGNVDLSNPAAAEQCITEVARTLGRVEILVNVAGGFTWQTLADGALDGWSRMFAMNALTCATMSKAALPDLAKAANARIINVGAGGAVVAAAGMGAYAASKSAVHRLTESLAAELSGRDITVNAVLPGIIDTPANRADMPDADRTNWVQPTGIADVILFLASPQSRAISGALIPVTRGG